MKLKIASDGTVFGTKITDENGNLVTNVTALKITWELDAAKGMTSKAEVHLSIPPCDMEVEGYLMPDQETQDRMKELEAFARSIRDEFPHDAECDGVLCVVCEAERLVGVRPTALPSPAMEESIKAEA